MEKAMEYIFGNLKLTDDTIHEIVKSLKHQHKVNRKFIFLSLMTMVYIYINDKRYKEEKDKLEHKLDDVIQQLKTLKGEHMM